MTNVGQRRKTSRQEDFLIKQHTQKGPIVFPKQIKAILCLSFNEWTFSRWCIEARFFDAYGFHLHLPIWMYRYFHQYKVSHRRWGPHFVSGIVKSYSAILSFFFLAKGVPYLEGYICKVLFLYLPWCLIIHCKVKNVGVI